MYNSFFTNFEVFKIFIHKPPISTLLIPEIASKNSQMTNQLINS